MKKLSFVILFHIILPLAVFAEPCGRMISLSPALTEAVFLLGKGGCLIARSSACDSPEAAVQLPVAGDFGEIIVERIISLRPDCVVTDTIIDASLIRPLTDAGIPVHVLPCSSVEKYKEALLTLGKLTGAETEAAEQIRIMNRQLAEFTPLPRTIRTLWIVWHDPLIIAGRNTLPDEAMTIAGLVNAATEEGYFKPSAEWLWQSRAQLVIAGEKSGTLTDKPLFRDLPAVRRQRIITLPGATALERPGSGFLPAVKELQKKVLEMLK